MLEEERVRARLGDVRVDDSKRRFQHDLVNHRVRRNRNVAGRQNRRLPRSALEGLPCYTSGNGKCGRKAKYLREERLLHVICQSMVPNYTFEKPVCARLPRVAGEALRDKLFRQMLLTIHIL